jgi:hypothetical protein
MSNVLISSVCKGFKKLGLLDGNGVSGDMLASGTACTGVWDRRMNSAQ